VATPFGIVFFVLFYLNGNRIRQRGAFQGMRFDLQRAGQQVARRHDDGNIAQHYVRS
jgi:hypothetical protein